MDGIKPNWLGLEETSDTNRNDVNVEKMQDKELEAKIGYQLNLWLEWVIAKRDLL